MGSSNSAMQNSGPDPTFDLAHRRWTALVLVAFSIAACRAREPAASPVPAAAPLVAEKPAAPATEPPPTAAAAPVAAPAVLEPKPGWSKLLVTDDVPLCAFADEHERGKALFVEQVRKQTLRANTPVTFGVFPPGCLNAACDDVPLLQCWVEAEGSTLTVHSRFASVHKDGSSCSQDCLEVDSACETPALPPGKYTVRYGAKQFELRIPSVLRTPCFSR